MYDVCTLRVVPMDIIFMRTGWCGAVLSFSLSLLHSFPSCVPRHRIAHRDRIVYYSASAEATAWVLGAGEANMGEN